MSAAPYLEPDETDRLIAALGPIIDSEPTPKSPGALKALANARLAAELDPVRRADRVGDLRLAAAVMLALRVEVAEALLLGVPVPADRLDADWRRKLKLVGDVTLDEVLALRVVASGPKAAT